MFPSSVSAIFQLRNLAIGRCLVAQGRVSQKGGAVVLRPCDPRDPEQVSRSHDHTQHRFTESPQRFVIPGGGTGGAKVHVYTNVKYRCNHGNIFTADVTVKARSHWLTTYD